MIRSELLKLKSSPTIYLLVSFTIFEIASAYGYLYWHRNLLTYKNIVLAFALAYPSLISVITNICFEQEREAITYNKNVNLRLIIMVDFIFCMVDNKLFHSPS